MNRSEQAILVEFSEARAYKSLMEEASLAVLDAHGAGTKQIASAVAVFANSIRNSLNMNRVIGLGLVEVATEGVLDDIKGLYSSRGIPFGIELSPLAQPPELVEWLRKR